MGKTTQQLNSFEDVSAGRAQNRLCRLSNVKTDLQEAANDLSAHNDIAAASKVTKAQNNFESILSFVELLEDEERVDENVTRVKTVRGLFNDLSYELRQQGASREVRETFFNIGSLLGRVTVMIETLVHEGILCVERHYPDVDVDFLK